jgi:hypothetical protein
MIKLDAITKLHGKGHSYPAWARGDANIEHEDDARIPGRITYTLLSKEPFYGINAESI